MQQNKRWRPEDYIASGLATVLLFSVPGILAHSALGGVLGPVCAVGGLLGMAWLVTGVVLKLIQLAERDR